MIKKELLDVLVCPACKGEVREENEKIVCTKCGRKYPIEDNVPIMLVKEVKN
jgi:uncharacterized protein YbaR (Trm112 family)